MKVSDINRELSKIGLEVNSIKSINSGAMRNTYFLKSNKNKYILKIFDKSKERKIQNLITILKKINLEGEICINPLNKRVLSLGDFTGFIYPFFEGNVFFNLKISNKLKEFGRIVGEFNKRTIILFKVRKESPNNFLKSEIRKFERTISFLNKNKKSYSKKVASLFQEGIKLLKEQNLIPLRTCLIHGDLHMQNVLYNKRRKDHRIIDCFNIDYGFLAREIMVVISHILTSNPSKNKKIISEILKGYESQVKLTKEEKILIPFFMLLHKMGEVNWLINQYNSGKISKSVFNEFMNVDPKQLKIIINQYDNLISFFS